MEGSYPGALPSLRLPRLRGAGVRQGRTDLFLSSGESWRSQVKIRDVELREVHLRLRERFEISTGGWAERRVLLLRMESEEGEAWSECVAAEAQRIAP